MTGARTPSSAPATASTAAGATASSAAGATSSVAASAPASYSNLIISTGQASAASSISSENSERNSFLIAEKPVLRSNEPSSLTSALMKLVSSVTSKTSGKMS